MRKMLLFNSLLTLLFMGVNISFAQILKPVKWSYSVEQNNENEATLILKATIDAGYHIYSQDIDPNAGPLPTTFVFKPNSNYSLDGKTKESKPIDLFDPVFGAQIKYFSNEATFRQKVKIKSAKKFRIEGVLTFMSCDDKSCQPPEDIDFSFTINPQAKEGDDETGNSDSPPGSVKYSVTNKDTATATTADISDTSTIAPSSHLNLPLEVGCGDGKNAGGSSDMSLLAIFIAGMLGGLLALLTPCVFPMIPLTVSFFTKRSGSRKKAITNALIYAGSIIILYVVLGLLVTVIFGSDALNDLASSGFFNMLFFIIFLIFAISFFGAFEITLPSSWINKADHASDRGGLIGIFFMAFTLSLVSFSCTGPIIGTLLVEAAHGRSYLGPILGMFGFSFALAVPFAIFAMFPNLLHSLPKSGGWLNTVKVCLGFLELALALKFLSNVDLAYHWNILHREIFVVLWVIIFALMGFYLLGKIKLSHDNEVPHVSIGRLLFAMLAFSFALYLTPGIWGAPLKLISGFPPPEFYKEWKTTKGSDCPHDLACFHDLDEGLRYARLQKKPVMIDFTGWSCVNCRKMEDNVWSDEKVMKRLSEDYVLISLYVDDKEQLPEKEQTISATTGKKIKTTGNKWSDLQASIYNTNSQPYYVLLDNKGKILAQPRGYTPDVKEYVSYLDEGLCRYQKRKAGEKNLAEK